jgi:hypothetical protein
VARGDNVAWLLVGRWDVAGSGPQTGRELCVVAEGEQVEEGTRK